MVVVHGLIHCRDVTKETANLIAGIVAGPSPGSRSREPMLIAPLIFAPEVQPVRSSNEGPSVTNPARAVGFWVGLMSSVGPIFESAINEHVLKHREGGASCTPA